MEHLANEYKLSLYEVLILLNSNEKTKVELVRNVKNNKIYIKKILSHYNINVYNKVKELNSPYVAKIYEIIEKDSRLIIIEEFINGRTLQEILNEEGTLEEKKIIEYMINLCDFLSLIHNLTPPIIHRDIKPANIIISNDNVLKVIDYDASRLYKYKESTDTMILGTQGYAAPEQFGFTQTDARSDIYSMGVLINMLITGRKIEEEITNGILKEIIEKCTKLLADHRYQNVLEIKEDLNNLYFNIAGIIKDGDTIEFRKKDKYNKGVRDILPGYRTNNPWKAAISSILYAVLIFVLIIVNADVWLKVRIACLLVSIWLLLTNFLNIQAHLYMFKNKSVEGKIAAYITYITIISLIFAATNIILS